MEAEVDVDVEVVVDLKKVGFRLGTLNAWDFSGILGNLGSLGCDLRLAIQG